MARIWSFPCVLGRSNMFKRDILCQIYSLAFLYFHKRTLRHTELAPLDGRLLKRIRTAEAERRENVRSVRCLCWRCVVCSVLASVTVVNCKRLSAGNLLWFRTYLFTTQHQIRSNEPDFKPNVGKYWQRKNKRTKWRIFYDIFRSRVNTRHRNDHFIYFAYLNMIMFL